MSDLPADLALDDPSAREAQLAWLGRQLLRVLGEDPDRPGLQDTPRRFARWWREFIEYQDERTGTVFENLGADQMVVVRGLRVWSLCEHHLLPFWCDLTIGYIPRGRVLGLSKFGRLARLHAHRLNLQEGLVQRLADDLARITGSGDIAVLAHGEHLCLTMRGPRQPHRMNTSVMRGAFRADPAAREEFFHLARGSGPEDR